MATGKYWVQGRTEDGLLFYAGHHWSPLRRDALCLSYDDAARVLEQTRVANAKAQEIAYDSPLHPFVIHQLRIVADVAKGRK